MAISSNTGDKFEYDPDDGYENSEDAYNDINFDAIASMVVHDNSLLKMKSEEQSDNSEEDEDTGTIRAP